MFNIDELIILLKNGVEPKDILSDVVKYYDCNVEFLKFLLENSTELPCNILNDAVWYNGMDFDLIKLLIESGAQVTKDILYNAVTSESCTLKVIELLLENSVELDRNILFDAVQFKRRDTTKVIKLLLKHGAELHSHAILNKAVVYCGCNVEAIKLLIKSGAKPSSETLSIAMRDGVCSVELIRILLESGVKPSSYHSIAAAINYKCNVEILNLILKSGAEIPRDILRDVVCCRKNDVVDVIKILLKNGAELKNNIFQYALESKNYDIELFKFLLKYGIKVNNDIFKNFKIHSTNINVFQLLLQYLLLQWFSIEVPTVNEFLHYRIFFEKSNFEDGTLFKYMCTFFYNLKKEIIRMLKDKISKNSTVFSFLSDRCLNPLLTLEGQESLVNEVLSRFYSGHYFYSRDLLNGALSKTDILHIINELNISVTKKLGETFSVQKVNLNNDTVQHFVSYLSVDDSISLILAFWHENGKKSLNKKSDFLQELQNKSYMLAKKPKIS